MSVHLQREIETLRKRLFSLCALVEEQVALAVESLIDRNAELACQVKQRDAEADQREVELEEECLKTLALHQPVAIDLRLVVSVLKINSDLERIGDLAVNIARKAEALAARQPIEIPFDLAAMWEKTRMVLRDSLDALMNCDVGLAYGVCSRDRGIREMKRDNRQRAERIMLAHPDRIPSLLHFMAVSRSLDRIADHAANVAEDAIYLVEGRVVRHAARAG